jgi:3-oxoacyl-[acyl-carrier-protein] synthase-3
MGVRIDAACALPGHGLRRTRARRLADAAAQACLRRAGLAPGDVDMLINAGVYREDGMGEPALAALIQEDISANPGHPPVGRHGTFSFDIANGICGVISAIQVVTGFLRSGAIKHGLIVTSDVHPNPSRAGGVPFQPSGGALLLSWDDGIAGFTDFHIETFPEYDDLFVSGQAWQARSGHRLPLRAAGRNKLVIDEKPGYQARCADCAVEATRHFLDQHGMSIDEIDLLIPGTSAPEFLDALRVRLGVPGDRVAYTGEDMAGAYTTGSIAALEAATKSGSLGEARTTLMLAAGAGITAALALYRQVPPGQTPPPQP